MINIAPKLITGEREDGKTLDRAGYSQALKDAGVTHEEAKAYWSNVANSDPYAQASKEIAKTVSAQAPKIAISNGKMTISAPQEVLDSPVVKQLQEELKSLKGADLNSAEVANAVQALNDEVQTTFSNAAIEQTFGWTPEEFNDYQYAIQSVSGTNPMKSTNKIKGYDKDGNVVEKTPQEWVKYYQENYNVDERTDALTDSAQSNNPYARTMSLVLMQGHDSPVYGFSATDRAQQGLAAFGNQMLKLPEGIFRLITEDNNTKRVESLAKDMGITSEALRKFNISNEERFDAKKKELQNKSWGQLSDDDKAFLLLLGVSKENNMVRDVDRGLLRDYKAEDLSNLSSENEAVSREAINHILANNSFDSYKETRDNYDTWQGYEQDRDKDDERLAKNAIWSSGSQGLGNLAGIVGRYFWEAALLRAATGGLTGGGFNVNATSDVLGEGVINGLAKIGISPASPAGQRVLDFTARLVGTIPEDILQTSIDNVVTYNADENENLFDPEQMSENFKNNLVVMALFNGARAGFSSLRRARMAKQLAKQADLDTVVNIEGVNTDVDDLARAIKNGRRVEVSDEKVSVIDENGNEKELKNITPEQGQMVQNTLFDLDTEDYSRIGIAQQNNGISAIPEELQNAWYENGDRNAREAIADIIESDPTVRNASLNKFYEDYLYWQRALDHQPLSFDEWLDSDIVLYRYSDPNMDSGSKTLSYSVAPGGLPLMGGDIQAIVIKPKETLGKAQLAGTAAENEVFVRRDIADKKAPGVGTYEYAVMEGDILKNKDSSSTAAKRAMTTRDIDVWSSKNLKDGDRVYTSSSEADADFGHNNVTKHTIQLSDAEWDDVNHGVYKAQPNIEVEPTAKVSVEVDTPDGKAIVDAPDYRPRDLSDALSIRVEPTPAGLKNWHIKSLDAVMSAFQDKLQEFRNRFNNVQVSDFDWVWYNTKNGLSPEKIIGTTDPTTGRTVTPEMIDAMRWWSENVTKDLRRVSREALGLEGDLDVLGYLPHTNYDPTNMSFDEAMTGRLWQTATGSSVLGDDNLYKGFGGTFENRYRTFASNMLWDAKNADVATAKLLEEAQLEGREITPELVEEARRATEGQKNIQQKVNESPSTKELTDALSSDAEEVDWGKIDENTKKQGENSGLGKAIHDNYSEVYSNANTAAVTSQQNSIAQNFDTLGNTMRKTVIGNGMSLYDWGGADLVYAPKNAIELVDRYMREGGDLRAMLTEYVENHSHRSSKYAQAVADKWIAKLGEIPGELTKGKAVYSLGNSMKWEAMGRIRKWLVMADYDKFNDATKKTIDRFLFNHMQMDSVKGNRTIGQKLTKALDTLTGLRYRALFYGNIKNALLQTSELNRYFSVFKWGDVATMAKRLATDENFRARVDTYVDAVAPTTSYLDAELYGKFSDAADSMEVEKNGVKFKDMGKKTKEAADAIGLGPIEAAESFKNRMMVAGLVQEADRLGRTGDEALRHIRRRFERVALAADEMGRIGLSSNPMAKTMLFLQNFQIRELGMHLYNISDEWKLGKTVPKKVYNATKYLTKVFGAKLATTLILARLGYSASQTMGLDPFGLLDSRYTGLDEEEMNDVDKMISGGVLTPFFSGGMTSLIADMYFMARKTYEDSVRQTVTDEAEATLEPSYGLRMPELTFEDVLGGAEKFVPGNVLFNRIGQMNEMMDTGWATSATGNKMYTAPTDPLNIALGYLFGRSATQNAQQYNQSYGDNLSQTLERILGVFDKNRDYQVFDPIDTVNYSDWFKGNDNDLQQFNIGLRYFRNERDRIIDAYEDAIRRGYSQSEDSDAKNNMNNRLNELYDKLDRFVDAYEKRNGTIDANMTKQIVNVLNTGRKVLGDTAEEASERSLAAYSDALARYASRGFSPVGTYTGPTEAEPDKEIKYQGSPQYRTAVSGYYDKDDELVDVLKLADKSLEPIRKQLQSKVSAAYDAKDYTTLESIQQQYLKQFDQVVAPIVAIYGVDTIKKNGEVENQLKAMLSSGSLIPSSQYARNKKGRYQSMPYEEVDVGAWARQRYGSDTYKNPSVRSNSTAQEDLSEVKQLLRQGKTSLAKAKALRLKVRIEGQKQALPQQDLTWLDNYLTGKGYN